MKCYRVNSDRAVQFRRWATNQTAAETIYNRAESNKKHMEKLNEGL